MRRMSCDSAQNDFELMRHGHKVRPRGSGAGGGPAAPVTQPLSRCAQIAAVVLEAGILAFCHLRMKEQKLSI